VPTTGALQCVPVYYSTITCEIQVCCSVLQRVAVWSHAENKFGAVCRWSVLQCVAMCCSMLQSNHVRNTGSHELCVCVRVCVCTCMYIHMQICIFYIYTDQFNLYIYSDCNTLQYTASHTLQHTTTHCNTLQRTATHCNTL